MVEVLVEFDRRGFDVFKAVGADGLDQVQVSQRIRKDMRISLISPRPVFSNTQLTQLVGDQPLLERISEIQLEAPLGEGRYEHTLIPGRKLFVRFRS